MSRRTVIIHECNPYRAFEDLKAFCRNYGLSYNTWSKKDLDTNVYYKDHLVRRIVRSESKGQEYREAFVKIEK